MTCYSTCYSIHRTEGWGNVFYHRQGWAMGVCADLRCLESLAPAGLAGPDMLVMHRVMGDS